MAEVSPARSYPELFRVTVPLLSLVFRTKDVWQRYNQFIETAGLSIRVSPSHPYMRAEACVRVCVLLLQDLLQSWSRGGGRRVEDMCYERRRAEACVDESAHHALVNAGGREIV